MRFYYSADCTIMAGGTMRGDQIYPPGVIDLRMIVDCFPFEDPVVVVRVSGSAVLSAIENGISKLPALEGRFPHVSGIVFSFDPSRPSGSRIVSCSVGGAPVDPNKKYTMATRAYMANGKDGFTALSKEEGAEVVVDEENGVLISMILRQYFLSLKVMGKWSRGLQFRRFFGGFKKEMDDQGLLLRRTNTARLDTVSDDEENSGSDEEDEKHLFKTSHSPGETPPAGDTQEEKAKDLIKRAGTKWARLAGVRKAGSQDEDFMVDWTSSIAPKLEGRITEVKA